ncbi:unnamed protein product, partial [Hymenolepis diminuta]
MKGTDYTDITLSRDDTIVCDWEDSNPGPEECANLIVDNVTGSIIFSATFSKPSNKTFETLLWENENNSISVNLDWINSGEAPEVKA